VQLQAGGQCSCRKGGSAAEGRGFLQLQAGGQCSCWQGGCAAAGILSIQTTPCARESGTAYIQ